jgi:putative DNA primase/helicase
LSCAFAGPLLEPLNVSGLGVHYFGDSTTGKSTALAVATSVWDSPKFMLSWRTTVNGLEIQAASRSSTIVTLDESNMIEAKALDASVYLLLNGVSKARMNKDTSARELAHWRICVLASGERSIKAHLGVAHNDHKVGQGIRIIDVPVRGKSGLFDDLHGSSTGSVFADKLRDASAKFYGHPGPLFVQHLINELPRISLPAGVTDIMGRLADKDNPLNPQEVRVARSFALIALAGELAVKWGVMPWAIGCVKDAAVAIFKNWRANQPKSSHYAALLRPLDLSNPVLSLRNSKPALSELVQIRFFHFGKRNCT